ncbi:MAG: PAS domain-containing protein [Bacillota bacterium]|nr:PAS domain-containing protein [Bacillota bacterium]
MSDALYQKIVRHLKTVYAYHRIICTDDGIPCDYQFLEVNTAFEKQTGLKGSDIAGKLVSQILPGIKTDKFDWISFYGDVALNKSEREFEQYSESLKKHFKVKVFSPRKYYFITLFDEVMMDKQTLDAIILEEIIRCSGTQFDPEIVDIFVNKVVPAGTVIQKEAVKRFDAYPLKQE